MKDNKELMKGVLGCFGFALAFIGLMWLGIAITGDIVWANTLVGGAGLFFYVVYFLAHDEKADICSHCGKLKSLRNPSGNCDHLYYPEYCATCKKNHDTKGRTKNR